MAYNLPCPIRILYSEKLRLFRTCTADFAFESDAMKCKTIAKRLVDKIEAIEGVRVPLGRLDISFYRDDFATYVSPEVLSTDIMFDIDGRDIVLVDDVLYTGRTIRAALDALMDIGRPGTVQLAVLIDRGHRQLPIRADYVGKNVPSSAEENVRLFLEETDGKSQVEILEIEHGKRAGSAPLGTSKKDGE